MTEKQPNTGGSAFPVRVMTHMRMNDIGLAEAIYSDQPGITRRDYFAAKALASLGTWMPVPHKELTSPSALRARALLAYQQADAMLAVSEETMKGAEA